jgi:VanZ family protein
VKRLAVLGILALATPAHAGDDDFDLANIRTQAHVVVSYSITLTTAVIARKLELPRWQAVVLGVAATAVLGTIKELVDDEFQWGDQLANSLGAGAATAVVFTFRL